MNRAMATLCSCITGQQVHHNASERGRAIIQLATRPAPTQQTQSCHYPCDSQRTKCYITALPGVVCTYTVSCEEVRDYLQLRHYLQASPSTPSWCGGASCIRKWRWSGAGHGAGSIARSCRDVPAPASASRELVLTPYLVTRGSVPLLVLQASRVGRDGSRPLCRLFTYRWIQRLEIVFYSRPGLYSPATFGPQLVSTGPEDDHVTDGQLVLSLKSLEVRVGEGRERRLVDDVFLLQFLEEFRRSVVVVAEPLLERRVHGAAAFGRRREGKISTIPTVAVL